MWNRVLGKWRGFRGCIRTLPAYLATYTQEEGGTGRPCVGPLPSRFIENPAGGEACPSTDRHRRPSPADRRSVSTTEPPASEARKQLVSLSDSTLSRPGSRVTLHLSAGQGMCFGRVASPAVSPHPRGAGNPNLVRQETGRHAVCLPGPRGTVRTGHVRRTGTACQARPGDGPPNATRPSHRPSLEGCWAAPSWEGRPGARVFSVLHKALEFEEQNVFFIYFVRFFTKKLHAGRAGHPAIEFPPLNPAS